MTDATHSAPRTRGGISRGRIAMTPPPVDKRADVIATDKAAAVWSSVLNDLEARFPEYVFKMWLQPVECVGERQNALCLDAPTRVYTWIERRYGKLFGDLVRKHSDYRGVFVLEEKVRTEREDGLF